MKYSTSEEGLRDLGIPVKRVPLTKDVAEAFMNMIVSTDEEFKEVFEQDDLAQIIASKFDTVGKKIEYRAALFISLMTCLPGPAYVAVIDTLNAFPEKEVYPFDIVASGVYPIGFWDSETAMEIIDKLIKPNLLRNSKLY